jgi:phosphoribosylaminoimidazolecarboxamide formyltransferase/IMP cyclohydrolase
VYDKRGLDEFARGLRDLGWELVASGNTAAALGQAGIEHLAVSSLTGYPEMLGGRVKTLHPAIHGGILADRSKPEHLADLEAQGIAAIDLVACNLYPFSSDPSVEMIDVGGPTMVRAAAKNFAHVVVVVSPDDYGTVLDELRRAGAVEGPTRRRLAHEAFAHTAAYDAAIAAWLEGGGKPGAQAGGGQELPSEIDLRLVLAQPLRYGENPHQRGARYRVEGTASWWDDVTQLAGTELSYLNLFDADAAWRLVHELAADGGARCAAAAIIKHANPCGAAVAADLADAYRRALACDPQSAFGGIIAIGGTVSDEVAAAVAAGPQADVIVASAFDEPALARLSAKRKATRLLSAPAPEALGRHLRGLGASVLVQDADEVQQGRQTWRVVTRAVPSEAQWADLSMAWRVCARTTSNAVVVVADCQAVGVGAGQQSRVTAAEIAVSKAGDRAAGGAAASDAFFPFPDGLEVLARAGVRAVVQPGGSVRDPDVIEAADASGIAMVLTGERHFRH